MKLGLLSDPHANILGLLAALAGMRDCKTDEIICAGDAVGYFTDVNETIDELRRSVDHAILGNHDAMLIGRLPADSDLLRRCQLDHAARTISPNNRAWLTSLPDSLALHRDGLTIRVFHGSPWSPLTEYVYPDSDEFARFGNLDADVVVLGHTHWPLVRRVNDVLVVNPGSCGQPRDGLGGAPYAVLDTLTRGVTLMRARYTPPADAIESRQPPAQ